MDATDSLELPQERVLHIRLQAELHRGVRIAAAEDDVSVQEWVRRALAEILDARAAARLTT